MSLKAEWKLDYKGKKKIQKKDNVDSLETLRENIKRKYELKDDCFELKYTIGKDPQYIELLDEVDFKRLKQQQANKIFVVGSDDDMHSSRIGKPSKETEVKPPALKKQEQKKQEKRDDPKEERKQLKQQEGEKPKKNEQEEKKDQDETDKWGSNAQRIQHEFAQKKKKLTTGEKIIPETLMKKIGDKPPKTEQKVTQSQNFYFQCYLCKRKFEDGPRYRCDTCTNYDVCHKCYQKDMHRDIEHQFIYIESKQVWEKFDMWPLLEAFVNPFFTWLEPRDHEPIKMKDIFCNQKIFQKYFDEQMPYYQKRINRYNDKWFVKWQQNEKAAKENKQSVKAMKKRRRNLDKQQKRWENEEHEEDKQKDQIAQYQKQQQEKQ